MNILLSYTKFSLPVKAVMFPCWIRIEAATVSFSNLLSNSSVTNKGSSYWWNRFPGLLTDTLVSALVVAWTALVPLAIVCLDRLPVGRLVGDPERTTQSDRKLRPSTDRNRKSGRQEVSHHADATCGACICRRSEGPHTAPLSHGRRDGSRTLWLRWWSWKGDERWTSSYKTHSEICHRGYF